MYMLTLTQSVGGGLICSHFSLDLEGQSCVISLEFEMGGSASKQPGMA